MTVHFNFQLPPETFTTPEQVISHATPLIPAAIPMDLRIEANPQRGLTISYSIQFPTPHAAAVAIVKALKTEVPT